LKRRARSQSQFVLEDESRLIGACSLPLSLTQGMQRFPIVWLEDSFDNRVQRILRDYVIDLAAEFDSVHGAEQGFALFSQRLLQSLVNVGKRMGGERQARLRLMKKQASEDQTRSGEVELHRGWIEELLGDQYDSMYVYQPESKAKRMEFARDAGTIR